MFDKTVLKKLTDYLWEIPQSYRSDMRVPARVYASEEVLGDICKDQSLNQLVNVTTLPGIEQYAVLMPDAHEGYGFPIGGVAAFSKERGVISPGGIGYDINCGVRLLRSDKHYGDIAPRVEELARALYREIPSGVGQGGRLKFHGQQLDAVLEEGAKRMIALGYGEPDDVNHIESGGTLPNAEADLVSHTAKSRGRDQLGTMGAGNHFIEVEVVEKIFDAKAAEALHLFENQVVILIHTGSRGLGHQIATDYIRRMMRSLPRYGITLPDRELACSPFTSPEGREYFRAMCAGANFAWANRQLITHEAREAWKAVFGNAGGALKIVYDVAHNIAKVENDAVVHRKGATRAFPNQPVLIPGSMGTGSYILMGREKSLTESFGSTCHGAGRRMSRSEAKRRVRGSELKERLKKQGIIVHAGSLSGLTEEAPEAYKDVDAVVHVIHAAGIAAKVARLRPVAVVKG